MSDRDYIEQIIAGGCDVGCVLDDAQATILLQYVIAVIEANRSTNLTRISDLDSAIRLHVVDSLSAATELQRAPAGALLDMGSGGGFPGVPLSVQSARPTVLLDSVAKKMAVVQVILETMLLSDQVRTLGARAEEHAAESPLAYSAVTARAVAPLSSLVELASPLLVLGGLFIAMKGRPDGQELTAGREAAGLVGLEQESVRAFELPGGCESRTIVCYRRTGEPRVRLPRRVGLAQHQPLV